MLEYYFMFALAFIWTVFAVVQDFKTKEVANWLNFSLIAFALAFRAFYSIETQNFNFFFLGVLGFVAFLIFGYALYYLKAFAGGDAKLLMGYGVILPYSNYLNVFYFSLLFLFLLFLAGAIYSGVYSIFIVLKNKKKFNEEMKQNFRKHSVWFILSLFAFVLFVIFGTVNFIFFAVSLICLIPMAYLYTSSLDKCMVKLYPPEKLTEGDWLEQNVKIGKTMIKKSVHGLSLEEIKIIRRYRKSVLIKEGIPFTPAFLISLIVVIVLFLKNVNLVSILAGVY